MIRLELPLVIQLKLLLLVYYLSGNSVNSLYPVEDCKLSFSSFSGSSSFYCNSHNPIEETSSKNYSFWTKPKGTFRNVRIQDEEYNWKIILNRNSFFLNDWNYLSVDINTTKRFNYNNDKNISKYLIKIISDSHNIQFEIEDKECSIRDGTNRIRFLSWFFNGYWEFSKTDPRLNKTSKDKVDGSQFSVLIIGIVILILVGCLAIGFGSVQYRRVRNGKLKENPSNQSQQPQPEQPTNESSIEGTYYEGVYENPKVITYANKEANEEYIEANYQSYENLEKSDGAPEIYSDVEFNTARRLVQHTTACNPSIEPTYSNAL